MLEKGEIDEARFAEKIKLKFPKPTVPMGDILEMWKPWRKALILRVLGRNVALELWSKNFGRCGC